MSGMTHLTGLGLSLFACKVESDTGRSRLDADSRHRL